MLMNHAILAARRRRANLFQLLRARLDVWLGEAEKRGNKQQHNCNFQFAAVHCLQRPASV